MARPKKTKAKKTPEAPKPVYEITPRGIIRIDEESNANPTDVVALATVFSAVQDETPAPTTPVETVALGAGYVETPVAPSREAVYAQDKFEAPGVTMFKMPGKGWTLLKLNLQIHPGGVELLGWDTLLEEGYAPKTHVDQYFRVFAGKTFLYPAD